MLPLLHSTSQSFSNASCHLPKTHTWKTNQSTVLWHRKYYWSVKRIFCFLLVLFHFSNTALQIRLNNTFMSFPRLQKHFDIWKCRNCINMSSSPIFSSDLRGKQRNSHVNLSFQSITGSLKWKLHSKGKKTPQTQPRETPSPPQLHVEGKLKDDVV